MTKEDLLRVMRASKHVVVSTTHEDGSPQSAVVGVAIADDLSVVFDTLRSTRKYANLMRTSKVAFTFFDDARTVQWEGVADEPVGDDLARAKELYFSVFPDGVEREKWEGITWIRCKPTWVRWTDFSKDPPEIIKTIG